MKHVATKVSRQMRIIGLTGSIGMGKSTAAKILRDLGLPVYNADQAVHGLLLKGGDAVKSVGRLFPQAMKRGAIDRKILGHAVFHHPKKLRKLEQILHPLVQKAERAFLQKANKTKTPAVVLEIPLLFETKAERRCDVTLCVTAPKNMQRERVMQRPGMTGARFKAILGRQMPDDEKRKRADYVVQTGKGRADTRKQLVSIMKSIQHS